MGENKGFAEDDSLSFVDLLMEVREAFVFVKKRIWVVALLMIAGGALGYMKVKNSKPLFVAEYDLMLSNPQSSMAGMFSGLASSFGYSGGGSAVTPEKVEMILTSKKIILASLDEKVDSTHQLSDLVVSSLFQKSEESRDTAAMNKTLVHRIIRDHLETEIVDNGILRVKVNTTSKEVTEQLSKSLVKSVKVYFDNRLKDKEERYIGSLQRRVDSLGYSIALAESELVEFKDNSLGLVRAKGMLEELRLKRNLQMLEIMYAEGVRNLEIAKTNLENQLTFIEVIDEPLFPLEEVRESLVVKTVLFAIIGLLLGGALLIGLMYYQRTKTMFNQELVKRAS